MHGAPTAWVAGNTGSGETIAIIDTGIFAQESEFAGRISSSSTGINGNNSHVGTDDHGTFVALVAAAANNGAGTVGIAYNANIMAIRADDPGSCAGAEGCSFSDIAAGIDWAVNNGATVVNISLGGERASASEKQAVLRAANAGVVVVVSAGNDGGANPDSFGREMALAGGGNVIIVGSVGSSGGISSFSNRAGNGANYYIAALGSGIRVTLGGASYGISGTSFSAPQVSGAVALLAQAFPNLTAPQLVELLLTSAQDVGVPGVDNIYGHGVLDIYNAFQPKGATTLAGHSASVIPLGDTSAVGSPAMGDALVAQSLSAIVLDKYQRAYEYDLGYTMRGSTVSTRLLDAVGPQTRFVSAAGEQASMAFTIDASAQAAGLGAAARMRLTQEDADAARVLAARVALNVSPGTKLGFAYAESADGLVMQLQGQQRPAFLVARSATGDDGIFRRTDMALAMRHQMGRWGLTISGESGETVTGNSLRIAEDPFTQRKRDQVQSMGVGFDRRFGGIEAVLGLSWMSEERTVLGARFHDAFGGGGANTMFVDASAGMDLAAGWRVYGTMRNGWTFADRSSVISSGSVIYSNGWSIDFERQGVFGATDRLGLRIAQPLRVAGGGLNLNLPVSYDYDTLTAGYRVLPLSLSPAGRELMGELAWHGRLWGGGASAGLFYRRDPGHYADMPDDAGLAVRWSGGF